MNTFNTKETYLAARAQWKAEYEQLSSDIRAARLVFRDTQREVSKNPYDWKAEREVNQRHWAASGVSLTALIKLVALRNKATKMLDDLADAKVEANRQWLEHVKRPLQPA